MNGRDDVLSSNFEGWGRRSDKNPIAANTDRRQHRPRTSDRSTMKLPILVAATVLVCACVTLADIRHSPPIADRASYRDPELVAGCIAAELAGDYAVVSGRRGEAHTLTAVLDNGVSRVPIWEITVHRDGGRTLSALRVRPNMSRSSPDAEAALQAMTTCSE